MATRFKLGAIPVDVVLKDIKNIHLSVYPPAGAVRISAPSRMSLDTIRVFAISKLGWIKQQQSKLRDQERETPREYLDRESHYVWGRRYLLQVVGCDAPPSVELKHTRMVLRLRPGADDARKRAVVEDWYRAEIKKVAAPLIAKWEPVLGVKVDRLFVQRMKTRWGSCNTTTRSIRLNTDLAKKPLDCLEYIVVHEMAHLIVRRHDETVRQLGGTMPTELEAVAANAQRIAPLAPGLVVLIGLGPQSMLVDVKGVRRDGIGVPRTYRPELAKALEQAFEGPCGAPYAACGISSISLTI
jgi:predicted metal-dependent hydrolase